MPGSRYASGAESYPYAISGVGQPIGIYRGEVPNPHIAYGQVDMVNAPTTFARIATRWRDVQLRNGWQTTNYGRRMEQPAASQFVAAAPKIPGQTRLMGTHPADFPMRGPAPSQWDYHVASTAGSQPMYPGGPGYIMGTVGYTGSSGG